jgi:hypothetical protein
MGAQLDLVDWLIGDAGRIVDRAVKQGRLNQPRPGYSRQVALR